MLSRFRWLVLVVATPHAAVAVSPRGSPSFRPKIAARRRRAISRPSAPARAAATRRPSRIAVRALGRLERPALVPDILPALDTRCPRCAPKPRTRSDRPLQGWKRDKRTDPAAVAGVIVRARRAAECRSGPERARRDLRDDRPRLPSPSRSKCSARPPRCVSAGSREVSIDGRLGVARASRRWCACTAAQQPLSDEAIALLRGMVSLNPPGRPCAARSGPQRSRAPPGARSAGDGRRRRRSDARPRDRRSGPAGAAPGDARGRDTPQTPAERLTTGPRPIRRRWCGSRRLRACARAASTRRVPRRVQRRRRQRHARRAGRARSAGRLRRVPDAVAVLAAHRRRSHRTRASRAAGIAPRMRSWRSPRRRRRAAPPRCRSSPGRASGSCGCTARAPPRRSKDRDALEKLAADEDDNVREAAVDGLREGRRPRRRRGLRRAN